MPNLFVASGVFHPESGGPATYLKAILPALQESGWRIRVLSYGDSHSADYPYQLTRIPRRLYPIRLTHYGIAAARQLAWADLVYAHTVDLPLWGGRKLPRVIKIVGDQAWERCIRKGWIPPDMSIDDFQEFRGDARVRWQKRSRSRQVAAMDAVIVPSEYLKRLALSWGVDSTKAHVIYNALPLQPLTAAPPADIRAELCWDDRPTLITVARLQPWKGVDHLIEAISAMPDLRLIVVGDGPDLARLQNLAAPLGERVVFTGQLPQREVHRMIRAADGLVLYSSYEGLSHTLLESLNLGTPVLASDVGGNAEVVRHGGNGLLLPHVDIEALRSGILQLLNRRAEFAAQSGAGLERFRFDTMAERTDALLRSLLP